MKSNWILNQWNKYTPTNMDYRIILLILIAILSGIGESAPPPIETSTSVPPVSVLPPQIERDQSYWINSAQSLLNKKSTKSLNKRKAKNVILFLGDGMSLATLAATRVYMGNENMELSFEQFPYTGLAKTYCTNVQVADSACSATAYLSGIKANYGTLGVTAAVVQKDCRAENNTHNHVDSILAWAQAKQKATGLVTTTRVTNASPAAVYAHSADREWENDEALIREGGDPKFCTDIAQQMIYSKVGRNLNVIMGGGRSQFLPKSEMDIEGIRGKRRDGKNLLKEWQRLHNKTGHFVDTKDKLMRINTTGLNHLLGLFSADHMPYHLEFEANKNRPSLEEMTNKALDVLEQNKNGYVLFVEGGRIDHGHHRSQARRALDETAELHKAVDSARKRTKERNTLIVVTSDHSFTMSISGYPSRGNDVLGLNDLQTGQDKLPIATLSYANGPGFQHLMHGNGTRKDLRDIDMTSQKFNFPSLAPLASGKHGGDDVAVFASGPWAHLFTGTYEQHFIPHAIGYAACLGKGLTKCNKRC